MKINKRKLIINSLIVICLSGIIYSSYNIIMWFIDSNDTKKTIDTIQEDVTIKEINNNDQTVIIDTIESSNISLDDPYWSYINMNLIEVDFTSLKETNSDAIGWIQLPGTNINYPFVQTTDNEYYLTHSFDKSYNKAGWLFLDYRNNNLDNKNNIIYAHGRYDGTMFGSLKNALNPIWQNNIDNHIVKISSEKANTLWQVYSVYVIPTTSDYIQTDFTSDEEYLEWLNNMKTRSVYNFNVDLNASDKTITLSTCYNNDEKLVLHARLIKIQEK